MKRLITICLVALMTLSTFADVDPEVLENAVNVSLAEAHPGEISVYSSSGLCLVVKPGGTYGSSNEVITTNNIWVKCKRIKKTARNTV